MLDAVMWPGAVSTMASYDATPLRGWQRSPPGPVTAAPSPPTLGAVLRLCLPIVSQQQWEWDGTRAELLTVDRTGPHQMEFLSPDHLLLLQCEGTAHACEWWAGGETGKVTTLHPGSVLFNPAHQHMQIRKQNQSRGRFFLLRIDPREVLCLTDEEFDPSRVRFCQRFNVSDEEVRKILVTLMDELETPGPAGRSCRRILTLLLLARLVRCASNLSKPAPAKGGLAGWRLRRAIGLIEADLDRAPSLDELARHVRLNPTYFCSAFKQSVGMSPRRYLFHCRIRRAKQLMVDPELSLTHIAFASGFGSLSRFSVIFKRLTGLSPSEYQRSQLAPTAPHAESLSTISPL